MRTIHIINFINYQELMEDYLGIVELHDSSYVKMGVEDREIGYITLSLSLLSWATTQNQNLYEKRMRVIKRFLDYINPIRLTFYHNSLDFTLSAKNKIHREFIVLWLKKVNEH